MIQIDETLEVPSDTGCDRAKALGYFGRCIECPFPCCMESNGQGKGIQTNILQRNAEIIRMRGEKISQVELARRFGLNRRTIQKILKKKWAGAQV